MRKYIIIVDIIKEILISEKEFSDTDYETLIKLCFI